MHADEYALQCLQIFKTASGAQHHTGQGILGDGNRQPGGMAKDVIEITQQRPAPGQHNTLIDDIGGQFRRGVLQRHLHRLNDGPHRLRQGFGDLALAED